MTNYTQNSKRIAKNTIFLYIRMIFVMAVALFSFRVLLKELGEEGYGLYSVVGGVVILFAFLSRAMTQSTQRFLSFYLGNNDKYMLGRVFSMSINVYILISIVILILAETVGLWFLNSYMNFPPGSLYSANVVYQCSIFTFLVQILTIPYQAAIISHERMSFYAYFSVCEALLKLSAVLILFLFNEHKVIIYAFSISIVSVIIWFANHCYCIKQFNACKYYFFWEKSLFKELTSFSGWNMLGGIGNVGAQQGVGIIFNIFGGVIINAAAGVSGQVSSAISSFATNLQTAFNPQIIKAYASEDKQYFYALVFRSSRFSFFLIYVLGLPLIICCDTVFSIWLTEIPRYAVPFTQLILVYFMIDAMSGALWTSAQATGKIKSYMITISIMVLTNVPAAYIIMALGLSPVYAILYRVLINLIIHFTRLGFLHYMIDFPLQSYLRKVMLPILMFVIISFPIPLYISYHIQTLTSNLILMGSTAVLCCVVGFYFLFTKSEKDFLLSKLLKIMHFKSTIR